MAEEKIRISIIDFLPFYGKLEAGKDKNDTPVYYGDTVKYNDENWFIAYRYGSPMLKQVGMMAMISSPKYEVGDFYNVERQNIIGAGPDWLLIGNDNDPIIQKAKKLLCNNLQQLYNGKENHSTDK